MKEKNHFKFIPKKFIIMFLLIPQLVYSAEVQPNLSNSVNQISVQKMSLDDYMMQIVIPNIKGDPFFSSDVDSIVLVEGSLPIFLSLIDTDGDSEPITKLVEQGIWDSGTVIYDFKKTMITFPQGNGGIADQIFMLTGFSLNYSTRAGLQCSRLLKNSY